MTTPRLLSNRYELGETLGYGGMSEVHRGRDVRLGREVAVKVLRADLARDPQFQERFRREAQNAAALNHPAIVAVYDTGETRTEYGPLPYIVMEYVDGRTLRDIVKTEGPLPGQRAMEIMADVCAALDFSHRHGIVHRDVKPANVMITRNGAVKVMDFGIARAVADGQAAVTQTAAVIGTAQYLSPEQARGESVDARSDVYAAGCVLYELLTGEPPFTGDSPVAVAYQHVREDPKPPSALNPRVSPALDAVVLKAMAKGAANRYQSAAEMRTDLVRVLSGQRPLAPMVMTDEVRTAVMTAGRPMQDLRPGRHRPTALTDDYDGYDPYADEEEERRRRRRKGWTIALITLLALALVGVIAWLATLVFGKNETPGDTAPIPNVIGMVQEEALRVLRDQGFTNVTPELIPCQAKPDGTPGPCGPDSHGKVFDTDPPVNSSVRKSDKITLQVGAPPEKVSVPDVRGKSLEDATKALTDAKLTVAPNPQQIEVDDDKLIDKVADQSPPAGQSVQAGTAVTLSIGKAPATVNVPNLVGQPFDTAKSNLEGLGFKVERKDVSSDQPKDTVVDQSPKSGKAKPGSTITLSVSNGDQQRIRMPNFGAGRTTVREAVQALQSAGWNGNLTVRDLAGNTCRGDQAVNSTIVNQDPNANEEIRRDEQVTVTVNDNCSSG
ncbi:MAG TPA: Stk1 family PASTA domain-containing Ser/Thr kinase [Actinophytocola sp.]|uniref:Stk1 family PASTA domain-containing Ser/Thr kinase n=1 Tax=Actinophytocola sp. TaxID=1872138 RepID=UPI002DDD210D|nr:Stk1 family PASTA domain-containing Ser/Thr kinase [Actinophytocola sp.]HEV2780348.1 Stk1 family PASTA domain-containing Ser/Thr kinase [Actinophytocola sp.]